VTGLSQDLCGQQLNIARPTGYVDPATAASLAAIAAARMDPEVADSEVDHFSNWAAVQVADHVANVQAADQVLVLEHMVGPEDLLNEIELTEVSAGVC
jgi:hypothetical protein